MSRRRTRTAAVTVVAIALVLASCSSDDDDAAVDDPTPSPTATAGAASQEPAATAAAEAEGQEPTATAAAAAESQEPAATATSDPPTPTGEPRVTAGPDPTPSPSPEPQPIPSEELEIVSFPVPAGSRPHDVAPALDGGVWYTAQRSEALGYLDPETGDTRHTPLGAGSSPHGVIVDADGVAWVTDGGLNAIVSVDPADEVVIYPLPEGSPNANLNTAAFDDAGILWFTGQNGIYGRLDPAVGEVEVFDAPRGRGPYGITATPDGDIYFASLAGSYVGAVSPDGAVLVLDPPTADQGARRVWSDSAGSIWVSEWNTGQLSRYIPETGEWTEWSLPGPDPSTYAVYVDEFDQVWVSDFGGNALHRFDPDGETFDTFPLPAQPGDVRQILGRPGEVWAAESANDSLVVIRAAG